MIKLDWNPPKLENLLIVHSWHKDYAAIVHEGGENEDGYYLPARPWTDATLHEVDFAELVAAGFDSEPAMVPPDEFVRQMRRHFAGANEALGIAFDMSMLDEIWEWPNVTVRADGSIVGSPRDIFDTGDLMNSREVGPLVVT